MVLNYWSVTFIPTEVLKHFKKGKPLDKFEYRADEDKTLCVVACIKENISRCNKHEGWTTDELIVTHRKPFKWASIDTMRRWIKDNFMLNNIVNCFLHSCQAASSSKPRNIDVNIDEIIRRDCCKNQKNVFKYHDIEIAESVSEDVFSVEFAELIIVYDVYRGLLINWS